LGIGPSQNLIKAITARSLNYPLYDFMALGRRDFSPQIPRRDLAVRNKQWPSIENSGGIYIEVYFTRNPFSNKSLISLRAKELTQSD
jgi:hypothetical protein